MSIRRLLVVLFVHLLMFSGLAGAEEASPYPLTGITLVRSILREGPGTSFRQVQVFNAGTEFTVLNKEGDWYQVERGQFSGYMRQDLIGLSGGFDAYLPPPPPPGSTPAPSATSAPPSASEPPAAFDPPAPPGPSGSQLGSRVLSQGTRGADVLELQRLLLQHGFSPNGLDGIFGPGTRNAVIRFQIQNGLRGDGVVGAQTANLLIGSESSAPPTNIDATPPPNPQQGSSNNSVSHLRPSGSYKLLSRGSSGAAVTSLQTALQILGYYTGRITGAYDAATVTAVRAFQANNGTGIDGIAGPATQTILYDRTPRPASEAAPGPKPLPEGAGRIEGPSPSQVELAHWFSDVRLKYRSGQTFTVFDPVTGLGWNLKIYAMGNHADSEPLTQLDTDIMFKAFGYINTWTPKPVYAKMPDGRWILATMHNVPHLSSSIRGNGFDGHLCVHFFRDMEEARRNDPNYGVQNQNAIRAAWERLKR
ncbi:MAG: peptidoglycan-binding protein [Clostridia bacterium]|nr:peptidoglycan-binding protein [Clostridia bacterium]